MQDIDQAAPGALGSAANGESRAARATKPESGPEQRGARRRIRTAAGVLVAAAAMFLAALAALLISGRWRTSPALPPPPLIAGHLKPPVLPPAVVAAPPRSALRTAPPGTALAILVLGQTAQGANGEVLELLPAIHEVRVQWMVPPGWRDASFRLSIADGGKVIRTVGQLGGIHEAGGSLMAEFGVESAVFAGSPDASQFRFIVSARDSGETLGEYPVFIRKTLD